MGACLVVCFSCIVSECIQNSLIRIAILGRLSVNIFVIGVIYAGERRHTNNASEWV